MTGIRSQSSGMQYINPLNAELNPICHQLALLGAHHIFHISRIRVKQASIFRKNVLPRSSEYKFEDGGCSEMLITNYKTRRHIFTFTILRTSNHTSLLNFVPLITYSYASNQCFPTCLPWRSP